ncbi:MAG TPA: RNA polymerase sigma factor [Oscillatoriales cyanobacterium M59_W2019_021]|nr:MAG: RNA polymerase sigma factor [Cyanobacteria bacterium J055]HIK31168.1 RNA polymerase sigma factor [Oscillatoriales cyanobacterium M4454_W2019_049]HIK51400.1 RNA polymerase sigma factor [Oscillatoriales cyanobacterium M59_W2019_021]
MRSFTGTARHANASDRILLQRLSTGDRAAFWLLWNQHRDYLYRRCLGWTGGNRTHAEEVLSQASLKAWAKLPGFAAQIANPKAWLIRLTYNLCVDWQRQRNRSAFGVENVEELTSSVTDAAISTFESPESMVLRREMGEEIRRAIDELPPRLRYPFVMRFCREMSYADIAQQLDLSNSNARKRIQQARSLLQKQLAPYVGERSHSPIQKSPTKKFTKSDRPSS